MLGSVLKLGSRALKCLPEFIFGESAHVIGKAYKAAPKGSIFSKAKVAGKAFESHVTKLSATKGGFFTRMWNSAKSCVKFPSTRAGIRLARMTGKSKIMGGIKGFFKGLGKKMPFIGAALTVAFEIPSIIKGYKQEGIAGALKQVAGAGIELGGMAAGAAIGSCICPGIGSLIGGVVGAFAGSLVRSKVAPLKEDEEEQVPQGEQDTQPSDTTSTDSSSPADSSSSSSSSGSSTSTTTGSDSTSTSTTTTPTATAPTATIPSFNPFNPTMTNPFGLGFGFNPMMGMGMNFGFNPMMGMGTGMFNPGAQLVNGLLQPGENIFLKYPMGQKFQYVGP